MTGRDNIFIRKIGENKKDFLVLLYEEYGKKLYHYGLKNWLLNEDDAWDITYKTLYKVIENYEKYEFKSDKKFGAFVFKVFVNYLRNLYRDRKNREEYIQFQSYDTSSLEYNTVENAVKKKIITTSMEMEEKPNTKENKLMTLLNEELSKLEDWQRILLLMRSQNIAYEDITKIIRKPSKQLKVYYQRLKERLVVQLNARLES